MQGRITSRLQGHAVCQETSDHYTEFPIGFQLPSLKGNSQSPKEKNVHVFVLVCVIHSRVGRVLQHVALLLSSFQVFAHTPCIRNHPESMQVAIFEDNFQDSAVCPWCAQVKMNAAASVKIQTCWEPFGGSWYWLFCISIMTNEVFEGVTASHVFLSSTLFCQSFKN